MCCIRRSNRESPFSAPADGDRSLTCDLALLTPVPLLLLSFVVEVADMAVRCLSNVRSDCMMPADLAQVAHFERPSRVLGFPRRTSTLPSRKSKFLWWRLLAG